MHRPVDAAGTGELERLGDVVLLEERGYVAVRLGLVGERVFHPWRQGVRNRPFIWMVYAVWIGQQRFTHAEPVPRRRRDDLPVPVEDAPRTGETPVGEDIGSGQPRGRVGQLDHQRPE